MVHHPCRGLGAVCPSHSEVLHFRERRIKGHGPFGWRSWSVLRLLFGEGGGCRRHPPVEPVSLQVVGAARERDRPNCCIHPEINLSSTVAESGVVGASVLPRTHDKANRTLLSVAQPLVELDGGAGVDVIPARQEDGGEVCKSVHVQLSVEAHLLPIGAVLFFLHHVKEIGFVVPSQRAGSPGPRPALEPHTSVPEVPALLIVAAEFAAVLGSRHLGRAAVDLFLKSPHQLAGFETATAPDPTLESIPEPPLVDKHRFQSRRPIDRHRRLRVR
mmetsp:Transcript_23835/g.46979  ORF Transcript_23835/g.46979 Transcript_23835/m.46979 type:complete len:273 (-) Transcript_23835:409-1227(-)